MLSDVKHPFSTSMSMSNVNPFSTVENGCLTSESMLQSVVEMEEITMESQDDEIDRAPSDSTQTEDDDEYEEEEVLVHVHFDCDVDTKLFNSEQPKIIGLDTDNPIMQMGPQFYRGTWQDTMGTSVFFLPDPDSPPIDPIFSRVKTPLMKLACHTRKSLMMSRVFVKPIAGQKSDEVTPDCENYKTEDTNQCASNRTDDTNICAETRTEVTREMEVETTDVISDNTVIDSNKL